jgi:hypothetical protein
MSKQEKNYEFYFESLDGKRVYFEKVCKSPTRTKIWKSLNDYLYSDNDVIAIGVGVKQEQP